MLYCLVKYECPRFCTVPCKFVRVGCSIHHRYVINFFFVRRQRVGFHLARGIQCCRVDIGVPFFALVRRDGRRMGSGRLGRAVDSDLVHFFSGAPRPQPPPEGESAVRRATIP